MTYEFTLIIAWLGVDDDDQGNALFEAGCDGATFGQVDGVGYGDFHREAGSFTEAVLSAIHAVECVPGLRVLHVEPDELVTASEIADRLKLSKEYVRLLGQRGAGRRRLPPLAYQNRLRD